MEDILQAYREVKAGLTNSTTVFAYENINVHFSGGVVNIYDYSGEMPMGRYRLPINEQKMVDFLVEYNEKISEIVDNNQYICGKCGGTFDLPEADRDRHGALICDVCVSGGDRRKEKEREAREAKKNGDSSDVPPAGPVSIPSTVSKARLTVDDAIAFLKDQGFVIKKSVRSFRVVASKPDGTETGVTDKYYRSKEDFEAKNPELKFISLVKELVTSDEEPLD